MELRPEQLANLPANQPLEPAYLIAGPETLRLVEAADAIRTRARADGITEREIFDVESRDFDWQQLASSFNAPSLFSSRRLIEIRLPGGKPGKEGSEVITRFCATPSSDVILLITCNEWSKAHHGKWTDAIARIGKIAIAWSIKPHELPDWITRRLHSKGLRANTDVIHQLSTRLEGNLLAAAQEIDKLALLNQGPLLDLETMESFVADTARYDVFRLTEAMLSGQPTATIRMLGKLRAEGEAVAALLPILIKELIRTTTLSWAKHDNGNLAAEMKAQGIWETRQAPFKRALQRHTSPYKWEHFVAEVGRIDRITKGRNDGNAWLSLERLMVAVAEADATRLLA
ncbi:DNA polymerase III subunit delta [Xylella fastidiosa]|uniref:DNA polymerase III subunit delta n=1 Tax=Xylella fastidiosa subsp. multiplex TaxID=644357 RepID=A0A9Q4MI97_XYLFS|nr:DNA polymerase III subunit delta [Xylella fastidiosa]ERI59755.1 DNA polymerase III subunit delta [Xylella fastidiosa subsp. multiplex Griffin-1]ACA12307.1 DNA polymerase III delta subunit [Xylella fastidiosa M12]KAJ4852027.1 DNA polymerase III subunit delta [Xylella fastidiosa subsp. multiplex]KFA40300.1 DNA polymerase III subunit delta [Xylella fastidiosa]KQH73195.1 DNA polymerase III subunit delta [Xylella fastidiosa]